MKKAYILFSVLLTFIFTGCSSDDEEDDILPPKEIPIESISIGVDTIDLNIGEKYSFEYSIHPANTTDTTYKVTMKSHDTSIAAIDDEYKVTALELGSTCVVAYLSSNSKITDTCVINVLPIKEERVSISKNEANMFVDEEITLTAQVYPTSATFKEIKWSSSNEQIAVVENGVVRALSAGEVSIFAESRNGLKAECKIVVENVRVEQVTITGGILASDMYLIGDVNQLYYEVLPENAFNKNVTITSSDESVVMIDKDFKLHAVGYGDAVVTIQSEDGYAASTYNVRVRDILSFINLSTSGSYTSIFGTVNGEVYCSLSNRSSRQINVTALKVIDDYGNVLKTASSSQLGIVPPMQSTSSLGGKFTNAYYPKFVWTFEYDGNVYEVTKDFARGDD